MDRRKLTAVVSIEVARQGLPMGWLYRDHPEGEGDSGWRVFSGAEPDDFADRPGNFVEITLAELLDLDPDLEEILDAPRGSCYEREDTTGRLILVPDFDLED